ncbi:hypothetical protein BJ138DRAFT_1183837 [Hygrophoropsis aurantiaca]|uniref:Uncharacterized protein n=1 Tax=Hygrophoropsis aurantiaca TaxID=72124 RepID=A0ACB7ZUX2_9AGAM|nr:hypothetical protein BJ138DRAFT_1183837 [Hygrophoropsis aurantiaca]
MAATYDKALKRADYSGITDKDKAKKAADKKAGVDRTEGPGADDPRCPEEYRHGHDGLNNLYGAPFEITIAGILRPSALCLLRSELGGLSTVRIQKGLDSDTASLAGSVSGSSTSLKQIDTLASPLDRQASASAAPSPIAESPARAKAATAADVAPVGPSPLAGATTT